MHDFYDVMKDILLPGLIGAGTIAVAVAAFVTSARAQRLAQSDHDRALRRERRTFAEDLRRFARALTIRAAKIQPGQTFKVPRETLRVVRRAALQQTDPHAEAVASFVLTRFNYVKSRDDALRRGSESLKIIKLWEDDPEAAGRHVSAEAEAEAVSEGDLTTPED